MKRLLVLVLCLSGVAFAQAEQTVEVQGEAAIRGNNELGAKDKAIEVALRNAVEQACGALVTSETLVQNSQLVTDKIYTQAKGYVSKYDVLSGSAAKGVYTVKIKATVGTGKLADDLASIGLTLLRKGLPRIAVLIVEQRIDDAAPKAWWTGPAVTQRISESTLAGDWLKDGFTFVDPETVASGARVTGVVDASNEALVRKLGEQLSEADVIIVGNALAKKSADLKALTSDSHGAKELPGVSCTATLTLRVLTADGAAELLAAGEESKTGTHVDALTCGRATLVDATATLSSRLKKDLLTKWNRQLAQGNRVRVVIKNVPSIAVFNNLKGAITNEVRGASVTGTPRFNNGRADIDLLLKGTPDEAAEQLEAWTVKGKKIKVTALTANTIDAEIR